MAYAATAEIFPFGWTVKGWAGTLRRAPRVRLRADEWLRADFRTLRTLYSFADFQAVQAFLRWHDAASGLLLEGFWPLMDAFDHAAQAILHVEEDPAGDEEDELWVIVRTGLPLDEAAAKLAQFDDLWWRDAAWRAPLVNFDVE